MLMDNYGFGKKFPISAPGATRERLHSVQGLKSLSIRVVSEQKFISEGRIEDLSTIKYLRLKSCQVPFSNLL